MSKTEGLKQFEVLAQKGGEPVQIVLWISMARGARGKKKLLGEAYSATADQPHIYFRVTSGTTEEEVYQEFLKLLLWRGYLPLKYRTKSDGRYGDWDPVSLEGLDIEKVMEQEGVSSS